jgi:4'-phosphopantetheinyl transferase
MKILNKNEVHLYWRKLDLPPQKLENLTTILSPDEQEKVNRFRFEKDQKRYIISRGILRILLANYLKLAPKLIKFDYNPQGKPSLNASLNLQQIHFNLSHSEGLVLYGITRNYLIGVDLEYIKPLTDGEKIAKRFFSPQEYQTISLLPQPEKAIAFFKAWTAKEAFLKATGEGISDSLDQIEFNLQPDQPLQLLKIRGNAKLASQWTLFNFSPVADTIATIIINNQQNCQLQIIPLNLADLEEF